jgi:hypothetical protein
MSTATKTQATIGYSADLYKHGEELTCRVLLDGEEIGWGVPGRRLEDAERAAISVISRHRNSVGARDWQGQPIAWENSGEKPAQAKFVGSRDITRLMPLTVAEIAGKEAEREAVNRDREEANRTRRERCLAEMAAENNARNGLHGIAIRS